MDTKLHERVALGKDYREQYDFELYGEVVPLQLKPLPDETFLPIIAQLRANLSNDFEDADAEALDEAIEEAEGAAEGEIPVEELDEDFVEWMQVAGAKGLVGVYNDDGNVDGVSDDDALELIEDMTGGHSLELGAEVLNLSGNVRDAEKFR